MEKAKRSVCANGEKIREARAAKGWSAADLAWKAGYSKRTIENAEAGNPVDRMTVRDIAETLKLEPRHFGALSGLGLLNIALGRFQAAIAAFEMALAHHPHLRGARENIKNLKDELKERETPI